MAIISSKAALRPLSLCQVHIAKILSPVGPVVRYSPGSISWPTLHVPSAIVPLAGTGQSTTMNAGPVSPCGPCGPVSPFSPLRPGRPGEPLIAASSPFVPAWPVGPCGPTSPLAAWSPLSPYGALGTGITFVTFRALHSCDGGRPGAFFSLRARWSRYPRVALGPLLTLGTSACQSSQKN